MTSGKRCRWRVFRAYPTSSARCSKPAPAGFQRRLNDAHEGHAMQLTGIHHLTAISARPRENLAFYTGLLGLRLVKKTVNQDDVSAYHLFYADGVASPGSDITFFDFPTAREKRGNHTITRTGFRVDGEATLAWWHARLQKAGVTVGDITVVDGRATVAFEDPEGQRLALVDDGGRGPSHPWDKSPVM